MLIADDEADDLNRLYHKADLALMKPDATDMCFAETKNDRRKDYNGARYIDHIRW